MKRENLIEQHEFIISNPFVDFSQPFDNVIIESASEEDKWIEETTRKIGEWRGFFRSAYIKWAISVNGLYLAKEKYEKIVDDESFKFRIHSLRQNAQTLEKVVVAEWDSQMAAKIHFDAIPMICTYGFTDLYNCLEEFVFDFYRIYWKRNPTNLIKGPDFKELRKLRNNSDKSQQAKLEWESAFNQRLDNWQRNKLYDNLGKVFLSYCKEVGIKKPSTYKHSSPETWAETITGISLVRNTIVHGGKYVSKELGEFCKKPHSLGFSFIEGEELIINLSHLQLTELFTNQILSAINLSLMEKSLEIRKENQ